MSRPRRIATVVHRYVGLGLALFLTLAGSTGALIAWNDELERVFAPALFVLPPARSSRPALDPFALREAAERAAPGYAIDGVDFARRADQPALFSLAARPGGPAPHDDEIALDPSTGRLLGSRRHGDLREGAVNLMPFVYDLHQSLALGDTGTLILGAVALLWTIDCFVGAYLTFPARSRERRSPSGWLLRWRRAWTIRRWSAPFKLLFDLHRAGGLWLWAMLFVLAWSSVGFNLPQVYRPVMDALFGAAAEPPAARAADPRVPPRLGWRQAHAAARRELAMLAHRHRFVVRSERLMFYDPGSHAYSYRVKSDRDPGRLGNTQLRLDGDSGRVLALDLPTGVDAGTTVTAWLGDVHTAGVLGRALQLVLTLVGLGIAMLSVTGIWIWWRKRSARRIAERVRAAR